MSFRDLALLLENGADDSYEPPLLWLIPIYLRNRRQYYLEAVKRTRQQLDALWEQVRDVYNSREEFERSHTVEFIWNRSGPPWWGLNDIIGWIDVRLYIADDNTRIELALFLPTKRISRRLVNKIFVFRQREVVPLKPSIPNRHIHDRIIAALKRLARDKRVGKYFVNLEYWERVIRHTDITGLVRIYRQRFASQA